MFYAKRIELYCGAIALVAVMETAEGRRQKSDEGRAPSLENSTCEPNENRHKVIHLRKKRSDVVFVEVSPDHRESNRGEREFEGEPRLRRGNFRKVPLKREGGFAPCAAERCLAIAAVALGALAETYL